jgi:hypothetical protein
MNSAILGRLASRYVPQCDGAWEHQYGIKLVTLDNPGWHLTVDLMDTDLEDKPFEPVIRETTSTDWVRCRIQEGQYKGFGGPENLTELIIRFLDWADR